MFFAKSKGIRTATLFSLLILILSLFVLQPVRILQAEESYHVERTQVGQILIQKPTEETALTEKKWLLPENFFDYKPSDFMINEKSDLSPSELYPNFDQVDASRYVVMDLDTGEILLEKGLHEFAYPASMTKILTAITVLEDPEFDPTKPVYFTESALNLPSPVSVRSEFFLGEETTTENALYIMMVASANDCAKALAETYGGTESAFVQKMNAKAEEIGCADTHMTDSAGFGLEDHYFTPHDLALIIRHAMQNEIFRELVRTKVYVSEPGSYHPYYGWKTYYNSNQLLQQGDKNLNSLYLHSYDGVKTGTTDLAGKCLAATVHTYDNRHLCAIVFDGRLKDGGSTDISIILRAILEEAAVRANCPDFNDAYSFLAENPDLIREISDLEQADIREQFLERQLLSEEEAETLFAEPTSAMTEIPVKIEVVNLETTSAQNSDPATEPGRQAVETPPEAESKSVQGFLSEENQIFSNINFLRVLLIVNVLAIGTVIVLLLHSRRKK